ncbi:hypothetical protein PCANB_002933 [Pneumocystis canis]|nr:hypothetical protein PCANB_002933 [Pneumocystis canis]
MNIFYNQALKQTQNLRKDLNLFQSFIADNIPSTAIPLQGQITVGLNSLSRTINEYEAISKKEMNMEKQEKAISRVKDFKKQYLELKEKFDNLKIKCTQMEHLNQKNKLLERRSYTNTLPENPYGYIQSNDLNEHDNDKLSRRHFLKATNSQLDDFLGQGQAILNDLIEQRLSIKGIQKKILLKEESCEIEFYFLEELYLH